MAKEGQYDLQLSVFKAMAENGISVDFINVNPIGVAYTVRDECAENAALILKEMGYEPTLLPHCAKVSVIGAGMAGVPGVMAKIAEALISEDIQILQCADFPYDNMGFSKKRGYDQCGSCSTSKI